MRPERLLQAAAFSSTFDRFVIPPMLVAIARDFGVPFDRAALAASSYFFLYGACQLLWGAIADRLGLIRVMRATMVLAGIAGLASALAPTLTTLVIARGVTGGLFGATIPSVIIYIGDTSSPERRQHVLADMIAALALATALATAVGGLCAAYLDWRVGFAIPAVTALVLVRALGSLPAPGVHRSAGAAEQIAMVFRERWAVFILAFMLLEGAIFFGAATFLAPALQNAGYSSAVAGLAVGLYGLSDFAWARAARLAIDRLGPHGMIAAGGVIATAGYATGALSVSIIGIAVTGVLVGGGFIFLHSTMQAWATQVVPAARAMMLALFATTLFVGGSLGTAVLAPLAADARFALIFALAAATAVPLVVVAALARRRYGTGVA